MEVNFYLIVNWSHDCVIEQNHWEISLEGNHYPGKHFSLDMGVALALMII